HPASTHSSPLSLHDALPIFGAHAARVLGAKPLRDETSVNVSGGFAYSPTRNVTFTADYFYIKIDHRIMLGATFDDSVTLAILARSEEHTSELQSRGHLVCRL